jgi:hypothetical protein
MDRSVLNFTLKRGQSYDKTLIKAAKDAKKDLTDFKKKFEAEIAKNK